MDAYNIFKTNISFEDQCINKIDLEAAYKTNLFYSFLVLNRMTTTLIFLATQTVY